MAKTVRHRERFRATGGIKVSTVISAGFTSDHPMPSMFDIEMMKLIKTIDVNCFVDSTALGFSQTGSELRMNFQ